MADTIGTYLDIDTTSGVHVSRCKRCHCNVNRVRAVDQGDPHARWCPASPNFDDGTRYKIVRMYANANIRRRTIDTRLTLKEAQAHCHNPETSSRTCTNKAGKARTRRLGAWFDGYEVER